MHFIPVILQQSNDRASAAFLYLAKSGWSSYSIEKVASKYFLQRRDIASALFIINQNVQENPESIWCRIYYMGTHVIAEESWSLTSAVENKI